MCAIGTILTAGAVDIWLLLLGGIILGIGNSVFHPADYTILGGTMDERYMGRAFSLHAFCGPGRAVLARGKFGARVVEIGRQAHFDTPGLAGVPARAGP
jgi:MFS family permease